MLGDALGVVLGVALARKREEARGSAGDCAFRAILYRETLNFHDFALKKLRETFRTNA